MAAAWQVFEARASRQLDGAQREHPQILEDHLRTRPESSISGADHRGEGGAVTRPSRVDELVEDGLCLNSGRRGLCGHRDFRGWRLRRGRHARPAPCQRQAGDEGDRHHPDQQQRRN